MARIIFIFLGLLLIGCDKRNSWQEEVRVSSQNLIVVTREFGYGASGDISVSHGPLTYASIEFKANGQTYRWEGRGLWPILLRETPDGGFLVVSVIAYCTIWSERGRPKSKYVFSLLKEGRWLEVADGYTGVSLEANLANDSGGARFLKEGDNRIKDNFNIPEFFKRVVPGQPVGC